ncbi:MAG: DNA polymerase III subunit delta' [Sphingomonadales bacterium]
MISLRGHDTQFEAMRTAIDSGRMHHAWLLHGPRGVGKGTFAQIVAARLLAEASASPPTPGGFNLDDSHPTAHLIAAGSHPDLVTLHRLENEKTGNLARNITVDQVRTLKAVFNGTPSQGDRRVVIVDSIDDMERGAANALLKNLEEPPASTIFLLVSHSPGRLLPTIRSRCRSLAFARLGDDVMASVLAEEAPHLDDMTRAVVIAVAAGSPGAALSVIEADVPGIDAALREIATTGDPHNVVRLDLAGKLALKAALPRYEAFLRRAPAFIATQARTRSGDALATAVAAWESARQLADVAIPQSLPAESVVFEIAGRVAKLAPPSSAA